MVPGLNSRDPDTKRHQSEPPGMSNKVGKKDSCAVTIDQKKDQRPDKSTSNSNPFFYICIVVGVILAVDGMAGYGHLAGEAATEACSKIGNTSAPGTLDKDGDQGRSEESKKAKKEHMDRIVFMWDRHDGSRAAMCGVFCYLVKTIGKPAEPEIKEKSTPEVDAEAEGEDTTGKLSTASYDAAAECHEARAHARRIWYWQDQCVQFLWFVAYMCAYAPIVVLVLLALFLTGAFAFGIIYAIMKAIYLFIIN